MAWLKYSLRRIFYLTFVLIGLSIIVFFLTRAIPSNPAAMYVGPLARPEQVEAAEKHLGLDRPLIYQYGIYVQGLVKGDLGVSMQTRRPVLQDIIRFLPNSLELIAMSILLSILIGVPLGVLAAQKKDSFLDHGSRFISIAGVSIPAFWLALLMQILFVRNLDLLPVGGRISMNISLLFPVDKVTGFLLLDSLITGNMIAFRDMLRHSIMPVMTLAAYPIGMFARMTRSSMLEVLGQDYIRTAKAYGIKERVIVFYYALKNALNPMLTVIGLNFAYALIGAFFVEIIFSWPGIGTYAVNAILSNDYPAIIGVCLTIAFFYVLINLIIDLLQAVFDPRIVL